MRVKWGADMRFIAALGILSAASIGLLLVLEFVSQDTAQLYMIWNLFLAWVPLLFAIWLRRTLKRKLWSSWEAVVLSAAWLAFLPNSFYVVSDLIHLLELDPNQTLYGAVMFMSFGLSGMLLGASSLYLVHVEWLKRWTTRSAAGLVAVTLFICSVAIYVGRDLRWNTWDVFLNPWGLLFDLSERLLHPMEYGQVLAVVVPFFVLLCSFYAVAWYGLQAAGVPRKAR